VNIGVFLLVIVISVPIMSISIRRLVLHPFQQILTAANAGEAPDTSSLASDEIGQLAGAFASLHERQLQTQEHLSDTVESLKKEIAGREAVESELRSSEEHLSATLRSIGDGVIATDSEGKVTSINPSAVDLTGWLSGDAIGRPLDEVFKRIDARTREELPSPIAQIMDSGEILDLGSDAILLSRTGMEHQIADSGAPIRNVEGESVGVVLVFRDVSSQRELEQQLRHAEKMTAIGQLAGGIAHDFNNMLGGISGALQIIRGSVSDDGEDREMVDLALQSASKASDLTAKLSSFARKGKLVSTAVDIHTSIQNAVSLLERSIDRRVSISTDLTAEASTVEGDASQLENALLNLGLNARDAMPDGGEITISTKIADLEESHCRASAFDLRPGPYIQISVRDTGTGMNDATLNRMFEPFFTTKEESKGTGLGLAAVYGAVKDHKGSIQACSKVGHGTVFHICLPLSESAEVIPEQSEEELPHGTGCILVVDDELAIRATSKRFLASLGYEVLLAEDGAEGVEVYRDNQDRITAVVLDMIMPRVDGKECFQELVKLNPEVKVIFSSGFVREDQLGALVGKQIVGFIKKPYRRAEFARLLALAASPA
jgi:PAS domain S-box-containing protein